jgi:hypothetical protein
VETIKEALSALNLGKSVAEFDEALERYFVETDAFRDLVRNRCDIIAGDKGTGKTALYRILQKKYATLPELQKVEVLPAFNVAGNPIFQQLADHGVLTEAEYNHLWKAYLVSFAGNWILRIYEGALTTKMANLDQVLRGLELRTDVDAPRSSFKRALDKIGNFFRWRSAQMEITISEAGLPVLTPKVEFAPDEAPPSATPAKDVPAEAILRLLNECLEEADVTIWIAIDRLDEAFIGHAGVEVPALRALLRTYLDLEEFDKIKLKLFVRRDLFSRITAGGFVNLTHINARKHEIIWLEDDLMTLLCRRVRENDEFCRALKIQDATDAGIFLALFPNQVDTGKRKPVTWTWMMRRIRDGNDVRPPRNLIDLVQLSQDAQSKREDNNRPRTIDDRPIIEPDALREGLTRLSQRRVEDTIFAEAAPTVVPLIEKFRSGKAEHNQVSLAALLGVPVDQAKGVVAPLVQIGFLEVVKDSYKVPSLFREGMSITQGKAFDDTHDDDE